MPTIILALDGLHCGGCVAAVEKALRQVENVHTVEVSLNPQIAKIEGTASAEQLIEAVTDIGFDAKLAS